MKKTILTIIGIAAMSAPAGFGQVIWNYDFGTGTGSHTSGASTTFLPAPSSGGGTARVRVGTGAGSFNLINPSAFGTGSGLNIIAPTNTSVNKFSIYDWTPATSIFTTQFDLRLSGGDSGTFYFFAGDGASFSDNLGFTGVQVFTGIRWTYGASDTITTNIRVGGSWVTTGLPSTPFAQNTNFTVSIVGNNSAASIDYERDGTNTLAANTWDLWIGSTKVAGLGKALLASTSSIDSFMFYGESSTGNVANLTLDNFTYANYAIPEPGTFLLLGIGAAAILIRRKLAKV